MPSIDDILIYSYHVGRAGSSLLQNVRKKPAFLTSFCIPPSRVSVLRHHYTKKITRNREDVFHSIIRFSFARKNKELR